MDRRGAHEEDTIRCAHRNCFSAPERTAYLHYHDLYNIFSTHNVLRHKTHFWFACEMTMNTQSSMKMSMLMVMRSNPVHCVIQMTLCQMLYIYKRATTSSPPQHTLRSKRSLHGHGQPAGLTAPPWTPLHVINAPFDPTLTAHRISVACEKTCVSLARSKKGGNTAK